MRPPEGCMHKHYFSQREWVWTVELWNSCHHGIFKCYYWTDSSSSQGVEVEENCFQFKIKQLGPTHLLCEAAVPLGEAWHRVATWWDLLYQVTDVFCLSTIKRKIKHETEQPAKRRHRFSVHLHILHGATQTGAAISSVFPHLSWLLTCCQEW